MGLSEVTRLLIMVVQTISLVAVMGICICRLNAVQLKTRNSIRFAYVFLAAGALGVLLMMEYHWETCLLAAGMAMSLFTERRESLCYRERVTRTVPAPSGPPSQTTTTTTTTTTEKTA